jgi:hypothetical protein
MLEMQFTPIIVTSAGTEHKRSQTSTQYENEDCNKLNPEN